MKNIMVSRVEEAFIDTRDSKYYVPLMTTSFNYQKLTNALTNPFKIILLYGPSGSGKSFLLQKFFTEKSSNHLIALYKSPTFGIKSLCQIYKNVTQKNLDPTLSLNIILNAFRKEIKDEIIIILDESQLYSTDQLELIRILSNEANLKFIISIHKLEDKEVFAQQHFKSRIFEIIEMKDLDSTDLKQYIEQKINLANADSFLNLFGDKEIKRILELTNGNIRDVDRLIRRFFKLYELNVEKSNNFSAKDSYKYIELAAIDLGMINDDISKETILSLVKQSLKSLILSGVVLSLIGLFYLYGLDSKITNILVSTESVDKEVPTTTIKKKKEIIKEEITTSNEIADIPEDEPMDKLQADFSTNPTYITAIKIAKKLYISKDYEEAINWSLKANEIDSIKEDGWIIFAESSIELGNKDIALETIRIYLNTRSSNRLQEIYDNNKN